MKQAKRTFTNTARTLFILLCLGYIAEEAGTKSPPSPLAQQEQLNKQHNQLLGCIKIMVDAVFDFLPRDKRNEIKETHTKQSSNISSWHDAYEDLYLLKKLLPEQTLTEKEQHDLHEAMTQTSEWQKRRVLENMGNWFADRVETVQLFCNVTAKERTTILRAAKHSKAIRKALSTRLTYPEPFCAKDQKKIADQCQKFEKLYKEGVGFFQQQKQAHKKSTQREAKKAFQQREKMARQYCESIKSICDVSQVGYFPGPGMELEDVEKPKTE